VRSKYGALLATGTFGLLFLFPSSSPRVHAQDLDWLIAQYPIVAVRGPITLGSNISRQFTDTHADHAKKCWDYYDTLFARSAGNRTEIYYSLRPGSFR